MYYDGEFLVTKKNQIDQILQTDPKTFVLMWNAQDKTQLAELDYSSEQHQSPCRLL